MSQETRAGIVALLFIAALVGFLIFLRGGADIRDRGYEIHVVASDAGGITVGATAQMAGVEIGRVTRVELTPERRARITLRIRSAEGIPAGSRFAIGSLGLMGDKYIVISPGANDAPPIAPGAVVTATPPLSIEDLYDRVIAVARRAEDALTTINQIIGDPALGTALSETVRNARDTTIVVRRAAMHIERTARTLDRTMAADLPAIAARLGAMSDQLVVAATQAKTLVRDVAADGQTAQRVQQTVGSIQRAADGIEKMVRDLQGVVNEREVTAVRQSLAEARTAITDARTAITDARTAVTEGRALIGRANDVVQRVQHVIPEKFELPDLRQSARLDYGIWYDGQRVGHDVTLELQPLAPTSYVFTLREFGGATRVGIQVGNRLDDRLRIRYGLVDSNLGVGLDYRISSVMNASADLSNISQLTLNVHVRYALNPNYGLTLRAQSLLNAPTVGIGAYHRF